MKRGAPAPLLDELLDALWGVSVNAKVASEHAEIGDWATCARAMRRMQAYCDAAQACRLKISEARKAGARQ